MEKISKVFTFCEENKWFFMWEKTNRKKPVFVDVDIFNANLYFHI